MLTALFVAVFLFFLSVALLYANRQDIALSLSMEHKLRAQSEARSMAMEAYAQLRQLGELRMSTTRESDGGVESKLELVSLSALNGRGEVLLVRVRSTSGPVSAYYTLHLLESKLVDDTSGDALIIFPGDQESSSAVYSDFRLRALNVAMTGDMASRNGPIVRANGAAGSSQPAFRGYVPIFPDAGSTLGAYGPVITVGPPSTEGGETALEWLQYDGSGFEWQGISPPENLGAEDPSVEGATALPLAVQSQDWTNISLTGQNDRFWTNSWTDSEPGTASLEEAGSLAVGQQYEAAPIIDWSSAGSQQAQEWFVTRGTIAVQGSVAFSHAWHYQFRPYNGALADPVTALDGPQITRWPCVLQYNINDGQWSKAWAPLSENGDVRTELRPDPSVLMAKNNGELISITEGGNAQLLTLTGDTAQAGAPVPQGSRLFLYREQVHYVNQSGLIENFETGETLSFSSLPNRLPEVFGPLIDLPEDTTAELGEVGTVDLTPEGALEFTGTRVQTVWPEVLLNYRVTNGAEPALIGNELLISVQVDVELGGTGYPLWNEEFVTRNAPKSGTALARYDGTRWHILPNGVRALVERGRHLGGSSGDEEATGPGNSLTAPTGTGQVLVASYPNIGQKLSRYAIISIDTNPFEFAR